MFVEIENTTLALWVSTSLWAYPFLLSVHIVGLAIVVGIFTMRDLRLLGLFAAMPACTFKRLGKLAIIGFILNATSGILLFTSQASVFITSIPFLTKIFFITTAMILAYLIQNRLRQSITPKTKLLAWASLGCWLIAIIAGRLIAYIF